MLPSEARELGEERLGRGVPRVIPLFAAAAAAHGTAVVIAGDPGGVRDSEHGLSRSMMERPLGQRQVVEKQAWNGKLRADREACGPRRGSP